MRFSVDAHTIGQHLTGNETYVRNLLNCFDALDGDSSFIAYICRQSAAAALPRRFGKHFVSENPFIRLGFDLSRRLRQDRPDLIHVQYTAPLFCPVPLVVSVHDVSFLSNPEYFTRFRALQLRWTVRRTVRAAARVLTPSEFSRRSVIEAYRVDPDKVVVMPNAVSNSFRPMPRIPARQALQTILPFDAPFILTVGDLQPRKNHLGLIHAFEDLIASNPKLPHHLVMVGKPTWFTRTVLAAAARSRVSDRIHFTGYVEDDELLRFYAACDLFVYPSFYEGFGLPILEAMACGRAVACSNTTAMPEVANSCALLFDPTNRGEIVRAMRDLLIEGELRTRMERLGTKRATLFSWERTAQETLEVYYDVAGKAKPVRVESQQPVSVGGR